MSKEGDEKWANTRGEEGKHEHPLQAQVSEETLAARRQFAYDFDMMKRAIERKNMSDYEQMGGVMNIAKGLKVDVTVGVASTTLELRRQAYGWNKMKDRKPVSFFELLWDALGDGLVRLLIVAALVSIVLGMTMEDPHSGKVERDHGWIEGTAILISVAVVVLVSSGNDYQKAKKFEEMSKKQSVKMVQVLRDGTQQSVDSTELVVGDVMIMETGQQFTADGLLLEGQDIKINESAATGESDLIRKRPGSDVFFLSGTNLEEGSGRQLIVAVGENSQLGIQKERTEEGDLDETPLQIKLGIMADQIGKIGGIMAVILFTCLCIKETVSILRDGHPALATRFLRYLIVCVTLIVVCVPEGLPLAVTISLAYSMSSMAGDNCMVRIMASCETMGAATAICSDKTGTLTTNVMTVVQGYVAEEEFVFTGYGLKERTSSVTQIDRHSPVFKTKKALLDHTAFSVGINSTAMEQVIEGKSVWVGNKTEHGLLGWVKSTGNDYNDIRARTPNKRQYPFSSARKRMSTIVCDPGTDNFTLYQKGASEWIVEDCTKMIDNDGGLVDITKDRRDHIMCIIQDMAAQGNRTIAVSYCPLPALSCLPDEEPIEKNMIFMGVLGIQDPLREAVPYAVKVAAQAGITTRMVTGDNINTAIAIAKKCNIFQENGWDLAMTGPDFRAVYETKPEYLKKLVPRLRVLARSSPDDKYVLVNALQELGEVVGVTGDGTNDAPALKLSNVGFAMNTGTDIAKGAAHMILMDDNFATVVAAIRWGRAVNDNIRKFLQFQLTVNVAGVLITFIGAMASDNNEEPLKPVQLLWLNLIMDTLAALALATEHPEDASLQRPPVFLQAPLMSRKMITFVGIHGLFQLMIMMILIFQGHVTFDCTDTSSCASKGGTIDGHYCQRGSQHTTVIFNCFIWMQIINEFNARKLYGEMNIFDGIYTRSKMFFIVFCVIIAFQVFAVEAAGSFMSTTNLTWAQWLGCIAVGLFEIPVGIIVRLVQKTLVEPTPIEVQDKIDMEKDLRAEAANNTNEFPKGVYTHKATSVIQGQPTKREDTLKVTDAGQKE